MDIVKYTFHGHPGILPNKVCDEIIKYGLSFKKKQGTVFGNTKHNKKLLKTRNSFVTWLNVFWIYKEILPSVKGSNAEACWNYDIVYPEQFQFTEYNGDQKQHYDWHIDGSFNSLDENNYYRKVSTVVNLSDPKDYEGGDLEFYDYLRPNAKGKFLSTKLFKKRGSIISFPSFIYHRVKPVTKGTRHSLVIWHRGPQFK